MPNTIELAEILIATHNLQKLEIIYMILLQRLKNPNIIG